MSDQDLLNSAVSTGALFTATPLLTPNFSSQARVLIDCHFSLVSFFFSQTFLSSLPFKGRSSPSKVTAAFALWNGPKQERTRPGGLRSVALIALLQYSAGTGSGSQNTGGGPGSRAYRTLPARPLPKQKRGSSPQRRRSYHPRAKIQNLPLRRKRYGGNRGLLLVTFTYCHSRLLGDN